MAVIRIAGQRLGVQHELTAGRTSVIVVAIKTLSRIHRVQWLCPRQCIIRHDTKTRQAIYATVGFIPKSLSL
jgi:hypothetical protein